MTRDELTRAQARRVTLAAQGFLDRPHDPPTLRTLSRTLARTGVLQVDSVNVLQRAHYMPLYARMGPYDPGLLHRAAQSRPRRMVEYWAHVQAFMPVDLWPAMAFRRRHFRERRGKWGGAGDQAFTDALVARIRDEGPRTARQLDEETAPRAKEHWGWNWSQARRGLDALFSMGELAIAGRTSQFEVRYDLPERVLPPEVVATPDLSPADGIRELVRRAARSHGLGTTRCFADYYRLPVAATTTAVAELVDAGELRPVRVQGWDRQVYLHHEARHPRRVGARSVLSPFDPVCWERSRTEALFGFRYRIEIYVPADQRVHGYYVLPFLLGDRLVGRVDLKADRVSSCLLVPGAFAQPDAPEETAAELALELRRLAGWLGLDDVVVGTRGDLAGPLAAELPHS